MSSSPTTPPEAVGTRRPSTVSGPPARKPCRACLSQQSDPEQDTGKRLVVSARRDEHDIEMEFAATTEGENVEDKLAYLSDQPQIYDEEEISFRLLRHYASSVQHHKYHDIDIITVRVAHSS